MKTEVDYLIPGEKASILVETITSESQSNRMLAYASKNKERKESHKDGLF